MGFDNMMWWRIGYLHMLIRFEGNYFITGPNPWCIRFSTCPYWVRSLLAHGTLLAHRSILSRVLSKLPLVIR